MGILDYVYRVKPQAGDAAPHDEVGGGQFAMSSGIGSAQIVEADGRWGWRFTRSYWRHYGAISKEVSGGVAREDSVTIAVRMKIVAYDTSNDFDPLASYMAGTGISSGLTIAQAGSSNQFVRSRYNNAGAPTYNRRTDSFYTYVLRVNTVNASGQDTLRTWRSDGNVNSTTEDNLLTGVNFATQTLDAVHLGSNNGTLIVTDFVIWHESLSDEDCRALANNIQLVDGPSAGASPVREIRVPWYSQPPYYVPIDRSNRFGSKLRLLYCPSMGFQNLANPAEPLKSVLGSDRVFSRDEGIALCPNNSLSGGKVFFANNRTETQPNALTVFALCRSVGGGNNGFVIARQMGTSQPSIGIGVHRGSMNGISFSISAVGGDGYLGLPMSNLGSAAIEGKLLFIVATTLYDPSSGLTFWTLYLNGQYQAGGNIVGRIDYSRTDQGWAIGEGFANSSTGFSGDIFLAGVIEDFFDADGFSGGNIEKEFSIKSLQRNPWQIFEPRTEIRRVISAPAAPSKQRQLRSRSIRTTQPQERVEIKPEYNVKAAFSPFGWDDAGIHSQNITLEAATGGLGWVGGISRTRDISGIHNRSKVTVVAHMSRPLDTVNNLCKVSGGGYGWRVAIDNWTASAARLTVYGAWSGAGAGVTVPWTQGAAKTVVFELDMTDNANAKAKIYVSTGETYDLNISNNVTDPTPSSNLGAGTVEFGSSNSSPIHLVAVIQGTNPEMSVSLVQNPWQIFTDIEGASYSFPGGVVEPPGPPYRPTSDVLTTGWVATPTGDLYAVLDDAVEDDADYVTSPPVSGTPAPATFGVGPVDAGTWSVKVRAKKQGGDTAVLRVKLLDSGDVVIGTAGPFTLTPDMQTFQANVTTIGTAVKASLEVTNS
jgi:hypothetical protein